MPRWGKFVLGCALTLASARAHAGSQTFTASADTFTNSASPDNNNGGSTSLFTGREGRGGDMRALLRFAMPGALQGKVTVQSVTLTLTTRGLNQAETAPLTAATLSLRALVEAWGEGSGNGNVPRQYVVGQACGGSDATWNHPSCSSGTWSALSAPLATASCPTTIGTGVPFASTVAMVAAVQGWIDTPSSNKGWVVTSSTEGGNTGLAQRFSSREAGTNAPSLLVDYTTCTASANAACVTSQAGNTCVDPGGASSTYTCACGNPGYTGTGTTSCVGSPVDAGAEASADAAVDAGADAAIDAGVDAAVDASFDAAMDASADSGADASRADAGPISIATSGGCSCRATPARGDAAAWLAIALLTLIARRRR